jgi:hypothetical protein
MLVINHKFYCNVLQRTVDADRISGMCNVIARIYIVGYSDYSLVITPLVSLNSSYVSTIPLCRSQFTPQQ